MNAISDLLFLRVMVEKEDSPVFWANGLKVALEREFVTRSNLRECVVGEEFRVCAEITFDEGINWAERMRSRREFVPTPPAQARLPFSYQLIPPKLRSFLAKAIGRRKRRILDAPDFFPIWPIDLSADFLADLTGEKRKGRHLKTPVWLTHDLDSPEGAENLVKFFLPIEESFGAESTNFVVPWADAANLRILDEIMDRGHKIAAHGFDHSGITAYIHGEERKARIRHGVSILKKFSPKGYRSPSLLRTEALLSDLSHYYIYDSSIPTSGGIFPVAGNGCASARPYRTCGIWELPLSLPRDGSLKFLGCTPVEILNVWIECAEIIAASGGVVVLLTHCEERFSGNLPMLEIYGRFLKHLAESGRFKWADAEKVISVHLS